MEDKMLKFKELYEINVNDKTEKKNDLTYLSWCYAWAEMKKRYSDVNYEVERFNGFPYLYDPNTGYMVFTRVTADGITHEMWLPVMDGANNTLFDSPYTYKVKKYEWNSKTRQKEFNGCYEEKTVNKATMFDINKAIMRCLTKNIAMFGLGLYIYAGEDLPQVENPQKENENACAQSVEIQPLTEKELKEVFHVKNVAATIEWYERQLGVPFVDWDPSDHDEVRRVLQKQKETKARKE